MARGPFRRCHLCWQAAHLFTESLNHILVLRLQKASQKWRWGNNYSIVRIIAVYFIMPTQPLLSVLHQKHNICVQGALWRRIQRPRHCLFFSVSVYHLFLYVIINDVNLIVIIHSGRLFWMPLTRMVTKQDLVSSRSTCVLNALN